MKRNQFSSFAIIYVLTVLFTLNSYAQDTRVPASGISSAKRISAEDKAGLIAIFKNIDPKLYRLQFNGGREVYGTKRITMDEIAQIRKVKNPLDERGYVVFAYKDEGVMVSIAATTKTKGNTDLTSILSKESMAKLKAIVSKYFVEENIR